MLALHRGHVHNEHDHDHQEDESKTQIKLFLDRHALSPHPDRRCHLGSNLKSRTPVDSVGDGSKRHFRAASSAALASTGCPPRMRSSLTTPLGATTTSILTVPAMFIFRARSG